MHIFALSQYLQPTTQAPCLANLLPHLLQVILHHLQGMANLRIQDTTILLQGINRTPLNQWDQDMLATNNKLLW